MPSHSEDGAVAAGRSALAWRHHLAVAAAPAVAADAAAAGQCGERDPQEESRPHCCLAAGGHLMSECEILYMQS